MATLDANTTLEGKPPAPTDKTYARLTPAQRTELANKLGKAIIEAANKEHQFELGDEGANVPYFPDFLEFDWGPQTAFGKRIALAGTDDDRFKQIAKQIQLFPNAEANHLVDAIDAYVKAHWGDIRT